MMSRTRLRGTFLLLGLATIAAFTLPMGAQEKLSEQKAKKTADSSQGQMAMNCPMMAGLQGVELHSDSPVLLLAQADELQLSEEQQRQLRQLVETNRRQAQAILNAQQREQLADAPEGPLTPMQIAMMRMKGNAAGQTEQQEGQMCPMCMKMMRQKHQQDAGQHKTNHPKKDRATQ